jgi:hypothetical protein
MRHVKTRTVLPAGDQRYRAAGLILHCGLPAGSMTLHAIVHATADVRWVSRLAVPS